MNEQPRSSYAQILKSSAIIGGAQGLDLFIRMGRIKLVAMLLGPAGVGLIGLYQSAIDLIARLAGLGIQSSGVRQVAESCAGEDFKRIGRTVKTLRRVCWITGVIGWLLMFGLAKPLSTWIFGNAERAWALSLLGAVLLISSISGGQTALLQGYRRIEDLARVMVFSAAVGTVFSVAIYVWLGEQGIVIALIGSALIGLGFSYLFSRRVPVPAAILKWGETLHEARPLVLLGLAFMWGGILTAGLAFATRGLIIRSFGVDAAGIYQSAWGISGLFAGFILTAMGQDFYPRLTAVAKDNPQLNRIVNEQTEIGILLALPGLLTTLAFSPLVIRIFYTAKFMPAAEMLPWFVLGIFGRVVSWPLGYIQLAKGASNIFAATETAANALHLALIWLGLQYLGLNGVAVAFALLCGSYTLLMLWVCSRLSEFRWSATTLSLIGLSASFIAVEFGIIRLLPEIPGTIASILIVVTSGIYCARQISTRVGPDHRLSRILAILPILSPKTRS